MGLSSNCFSSKLDLSTDRENTTENIQGKKSVFKIEDITNQIR